MINHVVNTTTCPVCHGAIIEPGGEIIAGRIQLCGCVRAAADRKRATEALIESKANYITVRYLEDELDKARQKLSALNEIILVIEEQVSYMEIFPRQSHNRIITLIQKAKGYL
jgi:hypothetical protein